PLLRYTNNMSSPELAQLEVLAQVNEWTKVHATVWRPAPLLRSESEPARRLRACLNRTRYWPRPTGRGRHRGCPVAIRSSTARRPKCPIRPAAGHRPCGATSEQPRSPAFDTEPFP